MLNSLGPAHPVEVVRVERQETVQMSLGSFLEAYENSTDSEVLNCISLEVSDTPLGARVRPPRLARELCWVSNHWPERGDLLPPKVSKYCLLSMAGAFTDFHVDFGGSSVWYHVVRGRKTFYLAPPTQANLAVYRDWSAAEGRKGGGGGGAQRKPGKKRNFLGDVLSGCSRLEVGERETVFLPGGWIHAVVTEEKSIVLGGNFLHSYSVSLQLR